MLRSVLLLAAVAMAIAYFAPQYLDFAGREPARAATSASPRGALDNDEGGTGRRFRIAADPSGHFLVDALIDGRNVDVLVDTGATAVALRYEDARAMGLIRPSDDFDARVSTANGMARAKKVRLSRVRVGTITVSDVDALVTEPGALGVNLLGMSFLRRLARFEVSGGTLLLER
ncbi:TIGR02281 family clan AA aspartic protease [Starkeya sp. ORNL1]|uniref:retropepsin-like aspartic protease family protein n=1 Tax=Starkeya sp. ORNL1 TaxID=2709380 RepID=UPI001462940A|nr:TIGR02281 family clan AA aspartic protease [Starkeya sp. ORNL1]QJP15270.1 TIGR02281 family clan AA aspartic protease [Starkeya sp. ORNL1]